MQILLFYFVVQIYPLLHNNFNVPWYQKHSKGVYIILLIKRRMVSLRLCPWKSHWKSCECYSESHVCTEDNASRTWYQRFSALLFSHCLIILSPPNYSPHKVKRHYVHFRLHINYFILPWKICEEIKRRSVTLQYLTKGSTHDIKHMSIQPFMFDIFFYFVRQYCASLLILPCQILQ